MPRKSRFNLPYHTQHVIRRGNKREPCYFSEQDYRRYLKDLKETSAKYGCRIHAYVLMTDHVHLLVTPDDAQGIGQTMQALGRRYVCYVNKTYRRMRTLWDGRYKASLVDSDNYLPTCMSYIELNPVRAQVVSHPGEYRWSSCGFNVQEFENEYLTPHGIYQDLGGSPSERCRGYRELFPSHLDDEMLNDLREALNHELILGRSHFTDKIERVTGRQTKPGRPCVEEGMAQYGV